MEGMDEESDSSSSMSSLSSCWRSERGGIHLNEWLRSIVMSRICFDIFTGFHPTGVDVFDMRDLVLKEEKEKGDDDGRPDFFKKEVKNTTEGTNTADGLSFYDTQNDNEKDELVKVIALSKDSTHDASSSDDLRIAPPRRDVTIGTGDTLLAFVQVASTKENKVNWYIGKLFFRKVHQMLSRLWRLDGAGVCNAKGETLLRVKGTMLFCVLATDTGKDEKGAQMAVFACEQKRDSNAFRIAAIWRKELAMEELNQAYGSFINAVLYLKGSYDKDLHPDEQWKYLGPSCSKVTVRLNDGRKESFVLRAYENRVRATSRSPFLYKTWDKLKKDTRQVLVIEDSGTGKVLEFRDENVSSKLTLFERLGKVEVIAVPFIEGSHECTSIEAALSVVNFMQEMHMAGFVHGDVRGLNIVFSERTGTLIDHDFGGTMDQVVFPDNYVSALEDGRRSGRAGKKITEHSDITALANVLFDLHDCVDHQSREHVALLWYYSGRCATTVAGLKTALEELKHIDHLSIAPNVYYKDFVHQDTLDCAPISPPQVADIQSKKKHKTSATTAAALTTKNNTE